MAPILLVQDIFYCPSVRQLNLGIVTSLMFLSDRDVTFLVICLWRI